MPAASIQRCTVTERMATPPECARQAAVRSGNDSMSGARVGACAIARVDGADGAGSGAIDCATAGAGGGMALGSGAGFCRQPASASHTDIANINACTPADRRIHACLAPSVRTARWTRRSRFTRYILCTSIGGLPSVPAQQPDQVNDNHDVGHQHGELERGKPVQKFPTIERQQ